MNNKRNRKTLLALLFLIFIHLSILRILPEMLFPEIIFPSWMISISKTYVSEDHFLHPPLLYYLVANLLKITGDLRSAFSLLHAVTLISIDCLLFYCLRRTVNFSFAFLGMFIYLPWQIFFRGNSMWFDYATLPFLIISFIYYSAFLRSQKIKKLFLSLIFLSLGYFFKQTVLWTFFFYFVWLMITAFQNKIPLKKLFFYSIILFTPILAAVFLNFLFSLFMTENFNFAWEWSIMIPIFVYSRLPATFKLVNADFLKVILLLLGFLILSIMIGETNKSSKNRKQRWFLYTLTLVNLANIFPRWSDFRMQPFIFFLTLTVTYALYELRFLTNKMKKVYYFGFIILFLSSAIVFWNRIRIELTPYQRYDWIARFTPVSYRNIFRGKTVFAYDSPPYQGIPVESQEIISGRTKLDLLIYNPDKYYRIISPLVALDYVASNKPDYLIIGDITQKRLDGKDHLVPFEIFILRNYQKEFRLESTFWVYKLQ